MYAIRVVLQPQTPPPLPGRAPFAGLNERIRGERLPGIAHACIVSVPPDVIAMTFVEAEALSSAEQLAQDAWQQWLSRDWLADWQLVSCAGDLSLGVWAAWESLAPDRE